MWPSAGAPGIFSSSLMHPIGPELPISAHVACARVCQQLYVLCASHALVQQYYSRRRDRNNCVHWRSLYKGVGYSSSVGQPWTMSPCIHPSAAMATVATDPNMSAPPASDGPPLLDAEAVEQAATEPASATTATAASGATAEAGDDGTRSASAPTSPSAGGTVSSPATGRMDTANASRHLTVDPRNNIPLATIPVELENTGGIRWSMSGFYLPCEPGAGGGGDEHLMAVGTSLTAADE